MYEKLGDVRSRAVTMGQIADVLQDRGDLEEALRIRREEELPVYEKLGDVRELMVGRANLALTLSRRGDPVDHQEISHLLGQAFKAATQMKLLDAQQIADLHQRLLGKPL